MQTQKKSKQKLECSFEECTLQRKSVTIAYKKYYNKDIKNTLIFVHGLAGSSSAWTSYEKKLSSTYNIISLDLRGHGKSSRPKKYEEYQIEEFTEDIKLIAKHEKIKKFLFIGHSIGTVIILDFLKKYNNSSSGAILLSAAYSNSKNASKMMLHITKIIKKIQYLPSKNSSRINYKPHIGSGDWNLKRMYADISNTGIMSCTYTLTQLFKYTSKNNLKKLKKIEIPILLIHGSKDTIFSVNDARKINSALPNSELQVITGNHIIVLNNSNEIIKTIKKFSDEIFKIK